MTRVGGRPGVPFVQVPRDDCAVFDPVSLHAGPPVPGPDRELLENLAALVPPPRAHLVTYHGVLAPFRGSPGRSPPI